MADVLQDDIFSLPPATAEVGGVRIPVRATGLAPAEILQTIQGAVGRKYEGRDVKKHGMTLLEAALVSAAEQASEGDLEALEKLLNRLLGKPVQQVLTATGSLRDFLDTVGKTTEVIDVPQVVTETPQDSVL